MFTDGNLFMKVLVMSVLGLAFVFASIFMFLKGDIGYGLVFGVVGYMYFRPLISELKKSNKNKS